MIEKRTGFKGLANRGAAQEHLYFLFALLFVVPNIIFYFTEPLPALADLAATFIPLGIWMTILSIARKPGLVVWCLFPKLILDGGQLVLLYLFGESVIAVDMYLNLTSSNASEAGELLENLVLIIGCVALFYLLPMLWLAFRSVRLETTLPASFRRRWAKAGICVMFAGLVFAVLSPLQGHRFSVKNDLYPANAVYNLYFAIHKAGKNARYTRSSAAFAFHAAKPVRQPGKREIYILVVGETSRAMEWSLYGYERSTTPRLEKLDGLVYFTDAVTQSNNTHKSVPIILSAASAENYGIIYDQKSIVTAFKEAGFRTLVIANQKLNTSMIGSFYREADTFIDLSSFKTGFYLSSSHDGAVLPYLKEELDKDEEDLFVVLHTYGSHFNYRERYPKEFSLYQPDKSEGIRASHKAQLRNAYDNSIRYTDYVLSEIAGLLKNTGACATMVYLSDHGEDIFDDARHRYLHASPIPTYYQLHVPYFIWFSDPYRETYPDKYRFASSHRCLPVSTNSVFHTLLDLAGIATPSADSTLALTHPVFAVRDRMYLGDHDDPVPFWKVGLKEADFRMLDRWGIAYGEDRQEDS